MDLLTFLLYLSPVVVILYLYINKLCSYWTSKGVSAPSGFFNFDQIFPFGVILKRFSSDPIEFELEMTKKYGKVYGIFNGVMPTLTVADPEIAKTVLVKDFHVFMNRRDLKILHKHWNQSLAIQHGDNWKRMRSIVTPAFTSGRLRKMNPLLKQSVDKLEKYFESLCDNPKRELDIKSVIAGFTMDVIASVAFGTDTDTNGDRTKFNPFLHHGANFFMSTSIFRFIAIITLPKTILKILKIMHPFKYDSFDFFVNVIKTMINRKEKRDDLINMLKEAYISEEELKNMNMNKLTATSDPDNSTGNEVSGKLEKNVKYLTNDELIANLFIVYIAGFETTSSTLTNSIFHLAKDQHLQDRLYKEVTEKLANVDPNNVDEYYAEIQKIPLLEAILKETLRLYPPAPRLERRVEPDSYNLHGVELKRLDLVEISVIAIHYNPEYYEDPHTFNPDRFMPENKHKLTPYTYLPFGDGPRNCVGMRLAYQEAKICLASLVQRFRFQTTDKTPAKLEFPKKNGLLAPLPFDLKVCYRK